MGHICRKRQQHICRVHVGLGIPIDKLEAYASMINDLADAGIADETGISDFIDRAGASLKNSA